MLDACVVGADRLRVNERVRKRPGGADVSGFRTHRCGRRHWAGVGHPRPSVPGRGGVAQRGGPGLAASLIRLFTCSPIRVPLAGGASGSKRCTRSSSIEESRAISASLASGRMAERPWTGSACCGRIQKSGYSCSARGGQCDRPWLRATASRHTHRKSAHLSLLCHSSALT